ncbi:hypothetical protein Sste5346_010354 [Sporothrix stenoceras]|uniref:Transcription factor domain-containing protein n=1 Tax=Sporothrix stenoceras TaxID=5173 RepID=A0ABR3YH81_9PEZI
MKGPSLVHPQVGFTGGHPLGWDATQGESHFPAILQLTLTVQFKDVLPDNDEARLILDAYRSERLRNTHTDADYACPPPNFPFGSWDSNRPLPSMVEILTQLPPRDICEGLVARYLDTTERTHRLFHVPSLRRELAAFWRKPTTASYGWLAQLFVVLALGSATEATTMQTTQTTQHGLLELAEACLRKTPVIFRADLTLCRVLCLVIIAKMASSYMCTVIDSCGMLADMAVRGCMELGLHRLGTGAASIGAGAVEESLDDRIVRARLWTAAVFLKVQQAADSGTPLLLRPCDFDAAAIGQAMQSEDDGDVFDEDQSYQIIIQALPIAINLVAAANNKTTEASTMAVCRMASHEAAIRALLLKVQTRQTNENDNDNGNDNDQDNNCGDRNTHCWDQLQKPMLEIWLRRLLLIIYQTAISASIPLSSEYPEHYQPPTSLGLSLGYARQQYLACALAILVHQRQLLEITDSPMARMLTSLFKQDFFIASVGACAVLRDGEAEEERGMDGGQKTEAGKDGDAYPLGLAAASTKATIRGALYSCIDLWARDAQKSKCNYWAYLILQRLTEGL